MTSKSEEWSYEVTCAGQLAAALEVSGWPKPGNVHRTADFPDTRFEHFIAGSIALGPALIEVARRGIRVGLGSLEPARIRVGRYVKKSVLDVKRWHRGGNTHLGVSLLFMPLGAAAGIALARWKTITSDGLRRSVREVMGSTTPDDAVDVYEAITEAESGALGRLDPRDTLDLTDERAKRQLIRQGVTLYDVMKKSSSWDNVARELTTYYSASFEVGYPTFLRVYEDTRDVNIATVHTFLTLLSRFPDTFIARKLGTQVTSEISEAVRIGLETSRKISEEARTALDLGGLMTLKGKDAITKLDSKLRSPRNELNPGTTADITAASLFVAILTGFRP
jgi:triphosphoribosyl-dephospho-CoA synthase